MKTSIAAVLLVAGLAVNQGPVEQTYEPDKTFCRPGAAPGQCANGADQFQGVDSSSPGTSAAASSPGGPGGSSGGGGGNGGSCGPR